MLVNNFCFLTFADPYTPPLGQMRAVETRQGYRVCCAAMHVILYDEPTMRMNE